MLARTRVDADLRATGRDGDRRVAPAWLRVLMTMAVVGLVAALGGSGNGFWLGLPGVLLAGSIASTAAGVAACALPVLVTDIAAAALLAGGSLPPPWLVVIVPVAALLVLHGMSSRLRHERDALEHAAYSDPLTGLANRRMLMTVADHEIARHRRAQKSFTVVMLDLDGFKLLNDRFGHAAGDEMLCEVAAGLARALRSQDTIARLGGDEFCVIAPETGNPRALAEKIVSAVADAASGHTELRTSVGVALFPDDGSTMELLLRAADERLLAVKRRRHGGARRRAA